MEIGEILVLKHDFRGSKKGDKVLFLGHTYCSGSSCILAVIQDEHYSLILKNNNAYSLKDICDHSLNQDVDSIAISFNTIKPLTSDGFRLEDVLKEKSRLEKKLESINELIKLAR